MKETKINNITIILTVHNLKPNEYEYWAKIEKILAACDSPIHILVDNYDTYLSLIDNDFNEENIFRFDENIGKFKKIVKHLGDKNVNTKYIKIFDPDDYLDVNSFLNTELNGDDSIIITSSFKDFEGKIFDNQSDVDELIIGMKQWFQKSFGTPSTILPTSFLENPKFTVYPGDLDFTLGDDLLLAEIAFVNGAKISFREDICFYIYSFKDGFSSPENMAKRMDDVLFVKESIVLLREISGRSSNIKTISEMLKLADSRVNNKKQFKGKKEVLEKFVCILKELTSIGL